MDNLNILVEAKREYLEQLCILVCPVMIDTFEAMYHEANTLSKGRKVLSMFQKLLKDVPEWSETMAKQHTDNIADRCAWFKDLVAAVFVSSVKILSAVRLSANSKKMSVKLPTNEVFIHTCYKNAAKDLYKDPYIFSENQSEHSRNDKLYERFVTCVENTVKELIPVQQILQTYMSAGDDEYVEGQDADLQADEIDEYDENGENGENDLQPPMEESIPQMEGDPTGEEGNPELDTLMNDAREEVPQAEMPEEPSSAFQNEFKTISTRRPPQQEYEQEDLFADAAETRTKKLAY
tara:strand:- start:3067 stop:3945 length:879 start_codon:yes stop_codon:yes gene_type:complete